MPSPAAATDAVAPIAPVLSRAEWTARAAAHLDRADALTAAHRARASRGEKHPVDDFLFTYYSYKPALLRRWHPGVATELADAPERLEWRWYTAGAAEGDARVDGEGFAAAKSGLLGSIRAILRATARRAPSFGCFGMHEWAMLYRADGARHAAPLRLGAAGTDEVVEAHELRCTHFDAFRFFTADAVPRNRDPLSREQQVAREQPGCLHAGMDLYRWAVKLGPIVPGDVLLDAFELARDIRTLDMRASPYDLRDWGYEPVPVETAEGKATYVRAQRGFADRAAPLRQRLLALAEAR